MKKTIRILLALIVILFCGCTTSPLPTPTAEPLPSEEPPITNVEIAPDVIATSSVYTVSVNERDYSLLAYTINGIPYFKLRDIAFILDRTLVRFQIEWDDAALRITVDKQYTVVGGELNLTGPEKAVALPAPQIYVDGNLDLRPAYLIEGNIYQRLGVITNHLHGYLVASVDPNTLTASIKGVYTQDYVRDDEFSLTLRAGSTEALLNGEAFDLSAPPFIQNNAFFFPLESVVNILGGSYSFENETATVELFGVTTEYIIGSHSFSVNGKQYEVSGLRYAFYGFNETIPIDESFTPIIVNGVVFIPNEFRTPDCPHTYISAAGVEEDAEAIILGYYLNEMGIHEVKIGYVYDYLPDDLKAGLTYAGVVAEIEFFYVEKYYSGDIEIYVTHLNDSDKNLEGIDGKVCAIRVLGRQYSTMRGLRVGDTEARAFLLYGTLRGPNPLFRYQFKYHVSDGYVDYIDLASRYYSPE